MQRLLLLTIIAIVPVTPGRTQVQQPDCVETLCGCHVDSATTIRIRLSRGADEPVSGARLVCHDDNSQLGMTDALGIAIVNLKGRDSPGCGFVPACRVAYFRYENDGWGRPFWLSRFLRGEKIGADDGIVELLEYEPSRPE